MHAPEFEFVFGELCGVDEFFEHESGVTASISAQGREFSFEAAPLPLNKIAPLSRSRAFSSTKSASQ
jgi:hypothetical protein